jgi:hypothetical protein
MFLNGEEIAAPDEAASASSTIVPAAFNARPTTSSSRCRPPASAALDVELRTGRPEPTDATEAAAGEELFVTSRSVTLLRRR